jgi:3-oxoacyl-[acyl-carrier-protein] synthase-3
MNAAKITPDQLDTIIVALGHGDVASPATACFLQEKLGASKAVGFDLRAACAGFLVALDVARSMVEADGNRHILVVGADIASRTKINWKDRTLPAIFGDGAGAAVVGASPDPSRGFIGRYLRSDGAQKEIVGIIGGGSLHPLTPQTVKDGEHLIAMDGRAVWRAAMAMMPEAINAVLTQAGLSVSELDFLVTHQPNLKLLRALAETLGLPPERTHNTVERYGNTLAASLAITLDEAVRGELIQPGMSVVLAAVGAGMTSGALLLRW